MAASDDLGTWDPLSPEEIGTIFRSYPGRWCIAGGWALDLFAETRSRPHDDIDIVILRNDLPASRCAAGLGPSCGARHPHAVASGNALARRRP